MDLLETQGRNCHRHPWELARGRSICTLLEGLEFETVADIGSGDLYFAEKVHHLTGKRVYACDINYGPNELGRKEGIITCSDMAEIPKGTIDLLFLLDVLEHVEDENRFLQEVTALLSPGGKIIITVPAFPFLFSDHDVFLKHFRRYRRKGLQHLLGRNHLIVEEGFYFFSSLFSIKLLQKMVSFTGLQRQYENSVSNWKFSEKHFFTRLFSSLLHIDFLTNKFVHSTFNICLPGLSLCVILTKPA